MTLVRSLLASLLLGCLLQFSNATFAETEAYILLQDSPLAGFQYHEGKALWSQLKTGDALTLTREPDNPYDANAIRVDWQGHKLGYVPRRENADVARLMDKGQRLQGRITRLQKVRNPWERVRFEVLVPIGQNAPKGR
ncbi:MAG: HIRAN domain-containing protein [Thiobacillaceae bacterium]